MKDVCTMCIHNYAESGVDCEYDFFPEFRKLGIPNVVLPHNRNCPYYEQGDMAVNSAASADSR